MMCSAVDRTWVSEVPLAMTKKSVASETPERSRRTTSVALRSRASAAARWAVASEEVVVDWAIRGPFRNLRNALRRRWYRRRQAIVPPKRAFGMPKVLEVLDVLEVRKVTAVTPSTPRPLDPRTLLLDHPHLDLGLHLGVQADGDLVDAERLDRLVQVDLLLLDVEALALALVRDVGRRHRAEELLFLAHAGGKGELDAFQTLSERLRRLDALRLSRLETRLFHGDALAVAGRGLVRETAREQIVAGVPRRHLHDVAGLAEVLDRLAKNDFHENGSSGAIGTRSGC